MTTPRSTSTQVVRLPVVVEPPSTSSAALRGFAALRSPADRDDACEPFVPASVVAARAPRPGRAFPAYVPLDGSGPPRRLSELVASACEGLRTSSPVRRNREMFLACVEELIGDAAEVSAEECLRDAWRLFADRFEVSEDARRELESDVEAVSAALPASGLLVPPNHSAVVHIYLAATTAARVSRRARFIARACAAADRLDDALARRPVAELDAGREAAPAALRRLRAFVEHDAPESTVHVFAPRGFSILATPGGTEIHQVDDPLDAALAWLDGQELAIEAVVRAITLADRVADRAPAGGSYQGALPWNSLPVDAVSPFAPALVVHVEGADPLGDADVQRRVSRAVRTGRPLHVLWLRDASGTPSATRGGRPSFPSDADPLSVVMQRNACVLESALTSPERLHEELVRMAEAPRPGFAAVVTAERLAAAEAPERLMALQSGRAVPVCSYDPAKGSTLADRFTVADNPQPERIWPRHALTCSRDGDEHTLAVDLTFADAVALVPAWRDQFLVLRPKDWADDQVPLSGWLASGAPSGRVPFIWGVSPDGTLLRVLVGGEVIAGAVDAADRWRFVREMGGVCSEHAAAASSRSREQELARAEDERRRLDEAHATAIATARDEAARAALAGLASFVTGQLAVDAAAAAPGSTNAATGAPRAESPAPTPPSAELWSDPEIGEAPRPVPSAEDGDDEEVPVVDGPWVDSHLCTSCDECIGINPAMFAYNGDKQAEIVDPRAGTFEELVRAAEVCPARCIHVCRPLSGAPGVTDELVARAAELDAIPAAERVRRTYTIDLWRCDGCTLCVEVCEPSAIFASPDTIALRIDQSLCTSCGHCDDVCPFDAVMVQ